MVGCDHLYLWGGFGSREGQGRQGRRIESILFTAMGYLILRLRVSHNYAVTNMGEYTLLFTELCFKGFQTIIIFLVLFRPCMYDACNYCHVSLVPLDGCGPSAGHCMSRR